MKLEVKDLVKKYDTNLVLDNVNTIFESGKIYGLIGRNGAGKTTFFNCLNQDVSIDNGYFFLTDEFGERSLNTNDIGYVVSTPTVPEFLTAREFLEFFLEINENKIDKVKSIDEYFKLVSLDKKDQDKLLKDYSHGMKNKIQILVNIIANPKVILLDEPLTSLDIVVQEQIKKILKGLKKDHIIIFSTHILEIAMDLCDEILILNDKKISKIEKNDLNKTKYKEKIINSLKDVKND